MSKASFQEIESRLGAIGAGNNVNRAGGGNCNHTIMTDAANINYEEEEETETSQSNPNSNNVNNNNTTETLHESDLNPLLEMLLRGKNDDKDEETMHQSMAIYRKILRPSCYESCAATVGGSLGEITNATGLNTTSHAIEDGGSVGNYNGTSTNIVIREDMLVYAVRKKYSDECMEELMGMLLDAIEESHYNTNHHNHNVDAVDGKRILDLALIYGNVGASRAILQRYPHALQMKDHLRGQIPLHVACHVGMMIEDEHENENSDYDDSNSTATGMTNATGRSSVLRRKRRKQRQEELIELLITEGMKYNVGGYCGAGGLYEQDNYGTTPLMQLIHALNNPFTWDDDPMEDNNNQNSSDTNDNNTSIMQPKTRKRPLANLEICIKAAWNSRGPNNQFPILHEAMNISSPDAFYRIIDIVKYYDNDLSGTDQRGRTALVKAISMDNILQRRTSKRDVIQMILSSVSSQCATIQDGAGRLPLHIAVEMGLKWNDGLRDIIHAYSDALEEPHSVSGFYPFMLYAQAGPGNNDLNTLYNLIRKRPKLIAKVRKKRGRRISSSTTTTQVNTSIRNNSNAYTTINTSSTFGQKYRPLTPSVHRPLVHESPRNRYSSVESDSVHTIPTLGSSSTTVGGDLEDISFQPQKSVDFSFEEEEQNVEYL